MPELSSMALPAVIDGLRAAIDEAGGAEVFFRGVFDENLVLVRVDDEERLILLGEGKELIEPRSPGAPK